MRFSWTGVSVGGYLSGEAFGDGVGHDLPAGPFIPRRFQGVGVPDQGGVAGDAVFDGEQGAEPGHGVRCWTQADVPVGPCLAGAFGRPVRICGVGELAGQTGRGLRRQLVDVLGGQLPVDGPPGVGVEVGGFGGDQLRHMLTDPPFGE